MREEAELCEKKMMPLPSKVQSGQLFSPGSIVRREVAARSRSFTQISRPPCPLSIEKARRLPSGEKRGYPYSPGLECNGCILPALSSQNIDRCGCPFPLR